MHSAEPYDVTDFVFQCGSIHTAQAYWKCPEDLKW